MVQPETHEALITLVEAEAVLERRLQKRSRYTRGDAYLLSGLLVAPGGKRWHGDQGFSAAGVGGSRPRTLSARSSTRSSTSSRAMGL